MMRSGWLYPKLKRVSSRNFFKETGTGFSREEGGFGEYLVARKIIDRSQFSSALQEQENTRERLGEILVRNRILTRDQMLHFLSQYLGIPRVNLARVEIDLSAVSLLSEEIAWRYLLIPVKIHNGILQVAMADPANLKAIDDIRILTGYNVEPLLAEERDVESAIRKYLTVEKSIAKLAREHEQDVEDSSWPVHGLADLADDEGNDAPTVRLVDSLLQDAILLGASDIHWEPGEECLKVRYRIDGKLETKRSFPLSVARNLLARIKVMARLDISERRMPQDGRTSFFINGKMVDLRISSVPTVYGEKIVVRILDPETAERSLEALGMSQSVKTGVRSIISQPNGIFLVVGPTGSGKTTTLYAILRELASDQLNIVSIEDPVEYRIPGVVPIQVNTKTGLTFAHGLRSILRQDPDIIMVGEIRDEETARIAIAAALTGHLVLSTLHTNTAAEAFTRLLDMGIEPYLLAAVIRGVLSQRLIRRLCEHCKKPRELHPMEQQAIALTLDSGSIFQAAGCTHCRQTGYSGRIGLHELLLMTPELRERVLARESTLRIEKAAIEAGMIPLRQDGYSKVKEGLTTLEEVWYSTTGTTV